MYPLPIPISVRHGTDAAACVWQVAEVHNDIKNNAGSSKQSPEGQVARAKALERGQNWSEAIDAYLGITTQDTTDLEFLEGVSCLG